MVKIEIVFNDGIAICDLVKLHIFIKNLGGSAVLLAQGNENVTPLQCHPLKAKPESPHEP